MPGCGPKHTMSSDPEVIRIYNGIDIDSDLIEAAMVECNGLEINTSAQSFKAFPPGQKCARIIDSLKRQVGLVFEI